MINKQAKNKIGIFGGTCEGRLLAEFCQKEGIYFAVSVATAYGNQLLEEDTILNNSLYSKTSKTSIQTGRMDAQEMARWIMQEEITVVVDATHPFAQDVSREIRLSCHLTQTEYLRLIREEPDTETFPASFVSSFDEAAALLHRELLHYPERTALLTIGSKELPRFCTNPHLLSRIFVRVLPSVEAIRSCQDAGFSGKQIIAMQGPFSFDLNKALIRTVKASYLVTKESGTTGGFEEKLRAAQICGCQVIAIKRPQENEKGKSLEEIKKWLLHKEKDADRMRKLSESKQKTADSAQRVLESRQKAADSAQKALESRQKAADSTQKALESKSENPENNLEITLLGIGTGNAGQITWDGIQTLIHADAFLGAARMVEGAKALCCQLAASHSINPLSLGIPLDGKQECISYKKEEILSWLYTHPKIRNPVILFSGDTGFYSGAKGMYKLLQTKFPSACLRLIPGISSLSYFASKIGRSWEKAEILSFHGREETLDWTFADKKERFFLLDGQERLYQICRNLQEHGQEDALIWAGENLSYPSEKIICGSPKELLQMHFGKLLVAWVLPIVHQSQI